MLSLKKPCDIVSMRKAGKVVADILHKVRELIRPGVSTMDLEVAADDLTVRAGAVAAFKGYKVFGIRTPFPACLCISINEEIVHGIPDKNRVLHEGDIVSVDYGAVVEGYYGDAACTYPVGKISRERELLLDVTYRSLHIGMKAAKPGSTIGDIGHAIEEYVISEGMGIVRDYCGHGIGKKLHETPQVPNYGRPGSGIMIKPGMTFCIEPMVMSGKEEVISLSNGWTVVTADGSDAAHFEHTLLVTDDGVEVLTPWE